MTVQYTIEPAPPKEFYLVIGNDAEDTFNHPYIVMGCIPLAITIDGTKILCECDGILPDRTICRWIPTGMMVINEKDKRYFTIKEEAYAKAKELREVKE